MFVPQILLKQKLFVVLVHDHDQFWIWVVWNMKCNMEGWDCFVTNSWIRLCALLYIVSAYAFDIYASVHLLLLTSASFKLF